MTQIVGVTSSVLQAWQHVLVIQLKHRALQQQQQVKVRQLLLQQQIHAWMTFLLSQLKKQQQKQHQQQLNLQAEHKTFLQ
jgi:hypothetical protein